MVDVAILNTTDLHGALCQSPGVYAERNDGSLLQCATIVQRVRAEKPNALLVDCGDVIQGTAVSYLTRPPALEKMNVFAADAKEAVKLDTGDRFNAGLSILLGAIIVALWLVFSPLVFPS